MKDFDFEAQVDKAALVGLVAMPRELACLKVWKKKPFDPAHAIADLFMLANTEHGSHTMSSRNVTVDYKPGWVIWSFKGLADRWGWTRDAVREFMTSLEDAGIVRLIEVSQYGKAVELVDFVACFTPVQSPMVSPVQSPVLAANSAAKPHLFGTVGEGVLGEGEGESPRTGAGNSGGDGKLPDGVRGEVSLPSIEEVRTWAAGGVGVDPDYAEVQWRTTTGKDDWQTRTGRLIDWRNLWLGRWLQDRAGWMRRQTGGGLQVPSADRNGADGRNGARGSMTRERGEVLQQLEQARLEKNGAAVAELEAELKN